MYEVKRELFEQINFTERYEKLSADYSFQDNLLTIIDIDLTKEIMADLGYKARYFKGEQFFQIVEKKGKYKFWFHIVFEYGWVELMWYVSYDKINLENVTGDGLWATIYGELKGVDWREAPANPRMRDYDDMEDILRISFAMWEDFKAAFLKSEGQK